MNTSNSLFTLQLDAGASISLITHCLNSNNLKVVRSFDLRSACASFTDNTCPHHGTSPCDCQLVVLLIYGFAGEPASLVAHSHKNETDFRLVGWPGSQLPMELERSFLQALKIGRGFVLNADDLKESADPKIAVG